MENIRSVDELKALLDEMKAEFDGLKKAVRKPDDAVVRKAAAYSKAFWEHMHTGMPENALREGSDGAGGYLVPDEYEDQLVEGLKEHKGDARLQKKFTTDFLTKKQKKNEGEVPQYYVENSHPAIIEPRAWDEVQGIMKRRKASGKRHECSSPFSGMVICGDCGSTYGSKVWHSNDPYRKVIWQCNSKFKNEEKCRTPHVTEERLKDGFLEALSILHENRETLLNDIRDVKHDLEDCTEVNAKITETAHEMEVIAGLIQKSIEDNAVHAQDQEEYNRRYNELADHYEKLKNKLEALEQERDDREYKSNVLSGFLFEMTEFKYLDAEFTDARCIAMLDHVTIYADGRMIYSFLNGSDITVML